MGLRTTTRRSARSTSRRSTSIPAETGYLVFDVQGEMYPQPVGAGPVAFGPADASGFYASEYFSLAAGHYKATLYGKADLTDVKAK